MRGDENGTYIRGGMVGVERCFRCEPVLDFKSKKIHLEDSPAVPFLGRGLVAKVGKVMKRGVRVVERDVMFRMSTVFPGDSTQHLSARLLDAWRLD